MAEVFPYPIIIAGAGPAGLLLGQSLNHANIPFQIYEHDQSLEERSQGYRFKIHDEGVIALSDTLTKDQFEFLRSTCGRSLPGFGARLDAVTGNSLPGGPPPRIATVEPLIADRSTFRKVLARGITESIQFGVAVIGYELVNATVKVKLSDGSFRTGSLLVAADGTWSKTRKQYIPSLEVLDTGCRAIYGKSPINPELTDKLHNQISQAMSIMLDTTETHPITVVTEPVLFNDTIRQHNPEVNLPQDYMYWVLGGRLERLPEWPNTHSETSLQEIVTKLTSQWHPNLRILFNREQISQLSAISITSMPPVLPQWTSTRIALIGDAAHAMSPTAGFGASIALKDAALLGKCLRNCKTNDNVVTAVGEYEQAMRNYVGPYINWSQAGGQKLFGMKPIDQWQVTKRD